MAKTSMKIKPVSYTHLDVYKRQVFKGKGMPGHMGSKRITIQNLEVVRIDAENNLILVKGAVPGPKKALVTLKETVKAARDVYKRQVENFVIFPSICNPHK